MSTVVQLTSSTMVVVFSSNQVVIIDCPGGGPMSSSESCLKINFEVSPRCLASLSAPKGLSRLEAGLGFERVD